MAGWKPKDGGTLLGILALVLLTLGLVYAKEAKTVSSSYAPVVLKESFGQIMDRMKAERFYKSQMINGRMASADGPIKTFPLRGIKESPPYLHDERCLTLEDTVEFFNLMQQLGLSEKEKGDLVEFMRAL